MLNSDIFVGSDQPAMVTRRLRQPSSLERSSCRSEISSNGLQSASFWQAILAWLDWETLSYESINWVPQSALEESSPEGELLRTKLLRGSRILFFCAGYQGKRFIYEQARKYGIRSIIVDNHDSWARDLAEVGIIERFIPIDLTQSPDDVLIECLQAIDMMPIRIDGVCTFVELAVSIASKIARALNLPGPSPESVSCARDKSLTRSTMQKVGLPNVRNTIIKSDNDLSRAADFVGFPAVLKPISGAASLGVKKVNDREEFLRVYSDVKETISSLIVSAGALERRTEIFSPGDLEVISSRGVKAASVIDVTIIMEEYLDGVEVDIDMIMSGGECRYANVIDNGPTFEPFFAETWAVLPSLLQDAQVDELKALAIQSVKALGFRDGIFHVELKYTSKGPRLIEVNARMGGGPTRMIHKLVTGIDLVKQQFLIALGIPSRPSVPCSPLGRIAYAFINARRTGVVENIDFVDKYRNHANVVWILTYVRPYEQFIGPEGGQPSWLGDIVVMHPDGSEALRIVKDLEERIALEFDQRNINPPIDKGTISL
jgi:biotin carboxylase